MNSSATPVNEDSPLRLLTEAHELLLKANKVYFDRGNQDAAEIFHIIGKLTSIISRNREIESSNSNNHRHEIHSPSPYKVLSDSTIDLTDDNSIKEEEKELLPNCSARVSLHKKKPNRSENSEVLIEERSPRSVAISYSPVNRKRRNNEDRNIFATTVAESQERASIEESMVKREDNDNDDVKQSGVDCLPLEVVSSSSVKEVTSRTRSKASRLEQTSPRSLSSTPRTKTKKSKSGNVTLSDATSFEFLWHGSKLVSSLLLRESGSYRENWPTPIHTLILGTYPSKISKDMGKSFAHDQNAFWWIVGDCLQFRRSQGISNTTNKTFALCQHVRYDNVLTYEEQVLRFCSRGFALWNILASDNIPNDIQAFCQQHPSIRRIVLANGYAGCLSFYTHNKAWWDEDSPESQLILVPGPNIESHKAFPHYIHRRGKYCSAPHRNRTQRVVECIFAYSTSAAATTYGGETVDYVEKRNQWEKYCFRPGLEDFENWTNKMK